MSLVRDHQNEWFANRGTSNIGLEQDFPGGKNLHRQDIQ